MTALDSPTELQVAIVGGGPRGLWAAERLIHHARESGVPVDLTVFEPRALGVGAAYDLDQPDSWIINVRSSAIQTHLGLFDQWRARRGEPGSEQGLDPFPPRRLVGEFMAESWQRLREDLPEGCRLTHLPHRVTGIEPAAKEWLLSTATDTHRYPEVLLATGHPPHWPGELESRLTGIDRPVVRPYPAEELNQIPAGSRILIRGAALSFVDAALALTVERGGSFRPGEAGELIYRAAGTEPAAIFPSSRGGRFMEVKPTPGSPLTQLDLNAATSRGDTAIRLAADFEQFCAALRNTARQYLAIAAPDRVDEHTTASFQAVLDGVDGSGDPVADLRYSQQVAEARLPASPQWAVGEAWRQLYPAIIWRTSHTGRKTLPGFYELSRRLERVGFGPPPNNTARLLALIDAGVVDTRLMGADATDTAGLAQQINADAVIDAVLAPQGVVSGTLADSLVRQGLAQVLPTGRGLDVDRDGTVAGLARLAVIGRETEDTVLGNDTLSRTLHDVVERWARRVVGTAGHHAANVKDRAGGGMGAEPALTARLEPWEAQLLESPAHCEKLLQEYGSPVNVHATAPMLGNIAELVDAGTDRGVKVRVFFARKANKSLAFVDTVRDAGHGVDVASYRELSQVLDRGVPGARIILSAAIKPDALLELAVRSGTCVSVDSVAELHRLAEIAAETDRRVRIAPRLAPDPAGLPPTRFGERLATWQQAMTQVPSLIDVAGVHVHLHGYAAADRRLALGEALQLIDAAREAGQSPYFVDLGGGVPMSYLDDPQQWQDFQAAREKMNNGELDPFTWKGDPLHNTYPFHQQPTRGGWLRELLGGQLPAINGNHETAAAGLLRRNLALHLEPGRSVLDGCGVILARVAFTKTRSDGLPLVGLEMNRTQCRTTSDDILLDPVLVRTTPAPGAAEAFSGYLVGAYCIEDEVIVRRRMHFPEGVTPGDIIAIPNTAGYFMHILESASHQIPLARNVVLDASSGKVTADDIDRL